MIFFRRRGTRGGHHRNQLSIRDRVSPEIGKKSPMVLLEKKISPWWTSGKMMAVNAYLKYHFYSNKKRSLRFDSDKFSGFTPTGLG
jgi:hypothetical protein